MDRLLADVVLRYGLRSLPFVVLAAAVVWGVTHRLAAPGQDVSVLWGLVKYTKASR